ncbi:alpha/beta hydrolase-fold protein [Gordonia sp. DT101]|uniref:alpha/beta hydrolase-fold protein n=1 Tax=Gordonia sp. DT101 TaxID=3416545 RepID=UPI003CF671A2
MDTQVPVLVQSPANRNPGAPVMYLLNGSSGGEHGDDWTHATDANAFYGAKNVWTVTPIGGAASYYADWQRVDPAANFRFEVKTTRPLRWETFVTSELPAAFERAHGRPGPGRSRGIAGISMSGTSVADRRKPSGYVPCGRRVLGVRRDCLCTRATHGPYRHRAPRRR